MEIDSDTRRTSWLEPVRPVEVYPTPSWTTRLKLIQSLGTDTDARRTGWLEPLRSLEGKP